MKGQILPPPSLSRLAPDQPPFERGWPPKADGGLKTPFSKEVFAEGRRAVIPRDETLKICSRNLRKNATRQENHLWYDFLRDCKPRFTRQRIIGKYIVDFYCHDASLVIELDGSQHYEPDAMEHDETRTAYLNALGFRVLRFANNEVDQNFEGVCAMITEKMNVSSKRR